jgi:hypothetical protein
VILPVVVRKETLIWSRAEFIMVKEIELFESPDIMPSDFSSWGLDEE